MSLNKKLQGVYNIAEFLSSQEECNTCNLCEKNVGLVYLLDNEMEKLKQHNLKISSTTNGTDFLSRTSDGWCSAFDHTRNRCTVYDDRPLCCRIYPFDLMHFDREFWWVIFYECPIAKRFFAEKKEDVLLAFTYSLEREMGNTLIAEFVREDKISQHIDAFTGETPLVKKLRKFGTPPLF